MILIFRLVICYILLILWHATAVMNNHRQNLIRINVLLDQCNKRVSTEWNFVAEKGFVITQDIQKKVKKKIHNSHVKIVVRKSLIFCNGKKVIGPLRLSARGGCIKFNGVAYDGDFLIMPYKDTVVCINRVELEDYVTSVLKTESWPGWPLEVNKVFAIACRTYVMYKKIESRRSKRPYHVKNSNVHQTYKGKHDVSVLKDAVKQTQGIILGFKDKPILAMFDCCCGGIIPAYIAGFDFNKAPYLARTYACTHCEKSSLYSWQVSYEHALFEEVIKRHEQKISWLLDIHIIEKDKAGLVTSVRLRSSKKQVIISGKRLYSLLKDVKSFFFDIEKKSGKIIFTGRGFGHHLGLCQWGARQMVRDGWGYKSILRFYYPGVHFMQLN